MKKQILIIFLLLSPLTEITAQLQAVTGKTDYRFWLYLPDDSVLKDNPPVLVFLHGRSLSGTDLNRVKRYGVIKEIEQGRKIPAIVIAPQVVSGSWNPDEVMEVINYVRRQYQTDTNRLYVCGMSLGGYGTMHFAGKYSDRIAAGVALCGGGNTKDACNLSEIPFWIQHGTADEAVPITESRKMVEAIRSCNKGVNLIYTEIPGANHGALERIFRSDELYDWLLSHSKDPAKQAEQQFK